MSRMQLSRHSSESCGPKGRSLPSLFHFASVCSSCLPPIDRSCAALSVNIAQLVVGRMTYRPGDRRPKPFFNFPAPPAGLGIQPPPHMIVGQPLRYVQLTTLPGKDTVLHVTKRVKLKVPPQFKERSYYCQLELAITPAVRDQIIGHYAPMEVEDDRQAAAAGAAHHHSLSTMHACAAAAKSLSAPVASSTHSLSLSLSQCM